MKNDSNTQGVSKMVRPIMREPLFLAGKSEPATEADKQVVQDLAKEAGAIYRIKREVLVNTDIVDEYLENFKPLCKKADFSQLNGDLSRKLR